MSTPRVKIITVVLIASAVSLVLVSVQIHRRNTAGNTSTSDISATKANSRDTKTQSSLSNLSLEEWKVKIARSDLANFRSLMAEALLITDDQVREGVIAGIVDRWMLENPSEFIKYLASLEVAGDVRSLSMVAKALEQALTKLDPERAASDEILVLVQRLINHLAETDPEKALVWSKKWLLEDTMENAMVSIVRSVARTDIQRGLEILGEMKSPLRRSQALAALGAIWAGRDPNASLQWALGLPMHAERALTLNSVLLAISQTNPSSAAADLTAQSKLISEQYKADRAADLAARGLSEADLANDPENYKEMRDSGLISAPDSPDVELLAPAGVAIGEKVAEKNAADGVALVDSLEHVYLKLKTLTGVMEGWAKTDPLMALDYLNKNYPDNSDLIEALYGSWASSDALAAARGTSMVNDPALQSIALEAVVKSANGNVKEVAEFISKAPALENTDSVKLALANAMSYESPREAWQIATSISDANVQYRGLKPAFANLVIRNPAEAGVLLNSSNLSNETSERLRDMLDAVVGN